MLGQYEVGTLVVLKDADLAGLDEADLSDLLVIGHQDLLVRRDAAVHVDNELIDEASFAGVKEVLKVVFELTEQLVNQFGLQPRRQLWVELRELFND